MHMYVTSALQRTDMKAVGLQLALDLLHEKVSEGDGGCEMNSAEIMSRQSEGLHIVSCSPLSVQSHKEVHAKQFIN